MATARQTGKPRTERKVTLSGAVPISAVASVEANADARSESVSQWVAEAVLQRLERECPPDAERKSAA
jgi:hypothetical protein